MSFSSTPLGQNRRVDFSTFNNKPPSNGNRRPTSPHRINPPSYAYSAPTLGPRSPTKPTSPVADKTGTRNHDSETIDQSDSALARFARLKQAEQAQLNLEPERWNVKDTSVNIATAFNQAVNDMAPNTNNNDKWASNRPVQVPRSSSVEYEAGVAQKIRAFAAPPNKISRNLAGRRLTKTQSTLQVPDSEGEQDTSLNGRAKSPFDHIAEAAGNMLATASFYLKERGKNADTSMDSANGRSFEREASYSYEDEERVYRAQQQSQRANQQLHKRNNISVDNKEYEPPQDDSDSDDYVSGEDKTRRRKLRGAGRGLNTLPTTYPDGKRRKKRTTNTKGNQEGEDSDAEGGVQDQSGTQDGSEPLQTATSRNSAKPPSIRQSAPPSRSRTVPDKSYDDAEQALRTIPEIDEMQPTETLDVSRTVPHSSRHSSRGLSSPSSSRFSVGAMLGRGVHLIVKVTKGFIEFVATIAFLCGKVSGVMFDTMFYRPSQWVAPHIRGFMGLFFILLTVGSAWYALRNQTLYSYLPDIKFPSSVYPPKYVAPDVPAANIAELAERLQRFEIALSELSAGSEKTRVRADDGVRGYSDLTSRVNKLEDKLAAESKRAKEVESKAKDVVKNDLSAVKRDMEVLEAQLRIHRDRPEVTRETWSDDDARAQLRLLEQRVGGLEGGVKEALELSSKAISTPTTANHNTAAWWNKLALGTGDKSGITIKSTDGQDVTKLISHLVDSAVSIISKDTIARPDYALHSGGARVIPSLTTPTFEIGPSNLPGQFLGLITGSGYAIGRPPITALQHEQQNGLCWPFKGGQGQLGVVLSAPVFIDAVTVDHVPREIAFDMGSAPREMEVWGMVEGRDNLEKWTAWQEEKQARREPEAGLDYEEPPYPTTLPKRLPYIRIASFAYDIDSSKSVQTFPVDPEIQALGIDFGIVVLRVLSNWGKPEYTCLYRFRVHGDRLGAVPMTRPEEP